MYKVYKDKVEEYTTRSVELREALEKGTMPVEEFIRRATYNDELLSGGVSELELMANLVEAEELLKSTEPEFIELIKIRQERLTVIQDLINNYAVEAETIQFYLREMGQ